MIDGQEFLAVIAERRPGEQQHDARADSSGEIDVANGGLRERLYGPWPS
jgi:hypothetical protein